MGLDKNFDFHSGSHMFKFCHVLENEEQNEREKYGAKKKNRHKQNQRNI
jgi:hypothetical protein